jgi:cytochrome P450
MSHGLRKGGHRPLAASRTGCPGRYLIANAPACSRSMMPLVTPLVALSWVIVALFFIGALRIALKPPFRRDLSTLPLLRLWLVVGGLLGVAAGIWILSRAVILLHAVAVACLVTSGWLWWRARPSYGRSRGWPRGSLGIGASIDAIDRRDYYLEQAARHGPVFKMSQFGRPVVCVVGLGLGRQLLHDHRACLAPAALPYNRFVGKGMLRYMPRESHHAEGPLFRRALAMPRLDDSASEWRSTLQRRLNAFAQHGGDIRPVIRSWTVESLAAAFFGLTAADPRVRILEAAQGAMNLQLTAGIGWSDAIQQSLDSALVVIREAAAAHLKGGDTSSVLGALVVSSPDTLDDEGRLRNLFLIYRLGISDLSDALTWIAYQLATHPEWQERVAESLRTAGAQPDGLAHRIVLETLRLEQSEFLYRRTIKPFDFAGFRIPAGWIVRLCIQESHRDPQIFPNPSTFNPDRFLGRNYSRSEYATFGLDDHGCMGTTMVNSFGRTFVEEICAYATRTTSDSPLERGTRHRHHWRPGRDWRITLHTRPDEANR